jgi:hypothetical protein
MLANRVQYFIRNILQSSKLNRENFVNNKKKYNMMAVKNRNNNNMIIKRNFGSSSGYMPPKPDRDPDEFIRGVIAGTILGYWISFYIKKK